MVPLTTDTDHRALDRGGAHVDAREMFCELVRRYQDAAFATAYAILKDRAAAEDADASRLPQRLAPPTRSARTARVWQLAPDDRAHRVFPPDPAETVDDGPARRKCAPPSRPSA